jgi:predicted TIM-barrel fold metal-dependent hydrolase
VSGAMRVDIHLHVYESKAQARARKADYPIAEYGAKEAVQFSERAGDLEDTLEAMASAEVSYAVAANIFATAPDDAGFVEITPGSASPEPRRHTRQSAKERLIAYNEWLCDVAERNPQLIPFITLDPWALTPEEAVKHLRHMVESRDARGVKIHPNVQRFHASDERMWPAYEACVDLGVPILSHTGPGHPTGDNAVPESFRSVLRDFPQLTLIMAHLGGGTWTQTAAIADSFPNVMFDCCEIIAWTGAEHAPSPRQLAELIRQVGSDRVMMGSDFPWYDLDRTINQVLELPVLSEEEKENILGGNAQRLLNLYDPPVNKEAKDKAAHGRGN